LIEYALIGIDKYQALRGQTQTVFVMRDESCATTMIEAAGGILNMRRAVLSRSCAANGRSNRAVLVRI
jgi:hypothetical protein